MSFGGKGEQYCDSWKRGVGSLVLRWERLNMNKFVCQEVSRKGPCEVQKREWVMTKEMDLGKLGGVGQELTP